MLRVCLALCVLLVAGLYASPSSAQVAGSPFTCDVVFYQMRNKGATSQIVKFVSVSASVTPTAVYAATQSLAINALGYNPVDNYMYGIQVATGPPTLVRIGQTGYETVGIIANSLPGGTSLATFLPTAGAFDAGGRYYFAGQGTGIQPATIFRVDSIPILGAPLVAHQYNLSPTGLVNVGDFDFNGAGGPNGLLLAATAGNLYRIQLAQSSVDPVLGTATVSQVALTDAGFGTTVGNIGSAFYDAFASKFYVFDNGLSDFWEITNPQFGTPSPIKTDAAAYVGPPAFLPPFTPTDGSSCPVSGLRLATLLVDKSDGVAVAPTNSVTTYKVTVTNAGPYPANYTTVRDAAAPGLSKLSVTCSAPGGPPTAVCPAGLTTSTFEAGIQVLIFPPDTKLVFTVNALVTQTAGNTVTNTAFVSSVGADFNLSTPTNITSVDVDTVIANPTRVFSGPAQCPANTTESTLNLLSNSDFSGTFLTDVAIGAANTAVAADGVSKITGALAPVGRGINQNPFTGDPLRSVTGSNNWLFSNGKTAAAVNRPWFQPVGGLLVGGTYTFMVYMSNATSLGSVSVTVPNMRLAVSQGGVTTTLVSASATYAAPRSSNEAGGTTDTWSLVQGTFTANFATVTLSIANFQGASLVDTGDVVGLAQATLRLCEPAIDVRIIKTNTFSATALKTGTTTTYTIVVTNNGSIAAATTTVTDPAATGLIKTTVSGVITPPGSINAASLNLITFEATGVKLVGLPAGGTATLTVVVQVTGLPNSTVTNLAFLTPVGYVDSNLSNNIATVSHVLTGSANLSITKNDNTNTLVAGGTTSYTITIATALGGVNVVNALFKDAVVPGLSCTSVTCTGVVGAAVCPSAANTTVANMTGPGIAIPLLYSDAIIGSQVIFRVDCDVTATGR